MQILLIFGIKRTRGDAQNRRRDAINHALVILYWRGRRGALGVEGTSGGFIGWLLTESGGGGWEKKSGAIT